MCVCVRERERESAEEEEEEADHQRVFVCMRVCRSMGACVVDVCGICDGVIRGQAGG